MTAPDRKKLTQLSRRLTAAKARYRSLEKRTALIEDKRHGLEEKAGRLFDLLMGAKGARAGSKRRLSLSTQFKRAKDEAQRLRGIEDGVYSQLRDVEEKIATLEDNMRNVRKTNPGHEHLPGASAKQQRQYEHILESAKKYRRYGKRKKEVAARTVRGHANPKDAGYLRVRVREFMKEGLNLKEILSLFRRAGFSNADLKRVQKAYASMKGKRNPTARQRLAKARRSVKRAAKATLGAGSKLLGAGAKAIKNAVNLKKFPDDKLQAYKADLESSLTKLRASGGGKATVRFVQGRINAVNRELKKRNPHKRIKVRNSYIDLIIKGQAQKTSGGWRVAGAKTGARGKGKVVAQGRGVASLGGGRYIDKATGFVYSKRERANPKPSKTTYKAEIFSDGFKIHDNHGHSSGKVVYNSHSERINSAAEARREAAQFMKLVREGVLPLKTNPKRKRNLDHRDSAHQVKVHQHWRAGGLSQWQRAHHAGQRPLFEHGIKVKPKRNASRKGAPAGSSKWVVEQARKAKRRGWSFETTVNEIINHLVTSGANRAEIASFVRTYVGVAYGKKNPKRNSLIQPGRKQGHSTRNPSATSIRKKFAGRVTGAKTMYYAKGAPSGSMAKLGKLASIKIEGRRNPIKPTRRNPSVDLWLCCDTHGKLWLASSKPGLMFDGPPQNLGRINEIEYVEAKPHLGNPHQTLYFHKLGEETGQKPSLLVDQHGDLLIKGGAYRVTGRGIEN